MSESNYLELTDAIRTVLEARETETMFHRILLASKNLTHAEAASIFLLDSTGQSLVLTNSTNLTIDSKNPLVLPIGTGIAGWVAQNGEPVCIRDVSEDPRFYRGVDQKTGFHTRGYLCIPLKTKDRLIGTIQVLNRIKGEEFSPFDQQLLECFAMLAALAIEKSNLHEIELLERQHTVELALASEFQQRLFPQEIKALEYLELEGYLKVARQIGGDYFDALPLKNGAYFIIVADVCGKGAGAGLWMASLSNLLRYLISNGHSPLEKYQQLNEHFSRQFPSGIYITLFAAEIYPDKLTYISAGHPPMLLQQNDGTMDALIATGLPFGIFPEIPPVPIERVFTKGMRLILFSDGVTEAENREGEMFEMERIKEICSERPLPLLQLKTNLLSALHTFTEGTEQGDDITLLLVEAK